MDSYHHGAVHTWPCARVAHLRNICNSRGSYNRSRDVFASWLKRLAPDHKYFSSTASVTPSRAKFEGSWLPIPFSVPWKSAGFSQILDDFFVRCRSRLAVACSVASHLFDIFIFQSRVGWSLHGPHLHKLLKRQ